MSDGSEEVTASRDPASTDDLLEETEQLLSGESGGVDGEAVPGSHDGGSSVSERHRDSGDGLDEGASSSWFGFGTGSGDTTDESTRSWTGRLLSWLSPTRYFSPKAFLALVLFTGAAVLVGGSVVPFPGGRLVGLFAAAFLLGLVTAKRRYLEMAAAGVSVGAVAAFFDYAVFALVGGGSLIAVGTTAGTVAALFGYYFGRDLRDGLQKDL